MKISFAVMEILKATAVLFRLFNVTRIKSSATVLREGFFNKSMECTAAIERR
jgi:benzoate 4-monooxygenase